MNVGKFLQTIFAGPVDLHGELVIIVDGKPLRDAKIVKSVAWLNLDCLPNPGIGDWYLVVTIEPDKVDPPPPPPPSLIARVAERILARAWSA